MASTYDRKDPLYQKAKEEGYRSRAAYKLMELQKKFTLIKQGATVLDLGAWPGGWTQVAAPLVGRKGKVVAVDLVALDPYPESQVILVQGDIREPAILEELRTACGGEASVIISDMSPKLTGIPEADRYGAVALNELALFVAKELLTPGGNLVFKTFKCNEADLFINKVLRKEFTKIEREELDSTRKTSNEYYVVARGLKK